MSGRGWSRILKNLVSQFWKWLKKGRAGTNSEQKMAQPRTTPSANRSFVGRVIVPAGFRVPENLEWEIKEVPSLHERARVLIASRYDDFGLTSGTRIARAFMLDVYCRASELDEGVSSCRSVAELLIPPFALTANAWYGDLEVLIAYDQDDVDEIHPLVFNIIPDVPSPFIEGDRELEHDLAFAVADAMLNHPKAVRLHRAMVYYNEALLAWEPGKELRAVEALFIAAETLAPVALSRELETKTRDDLIAEWGVKGPTCPECAHTWVRDGDLVTAARTHVIFQGDEQTQTRVRKVSDGLEHGFKDLPDLHKMAKDCRNDAARYVRRAILSLLGLSDATVDQLLTGRYAKPVRRDAVKHSISTVLKGAHDNLAPAGQRHPIFQVQLQTEDATISPDGKGELRMTKNVNVKLGEGTHADGLKLLASDRATAMNVVAAKLTKGETGEVIDLMQPEAAADPIHEKGNDDGEE